MTETARIYGGSLYDLAAEENLTGEILGADGTDPHTFYGRIRSMNDCCQNLRFLRWKETG